MTISSALLSSRVSHSFASEICRYRNPRDSRNCRFLAHQAMKRTRRQPEAPSDQHRRFIETARRLECDEDKERFEEKPKRIAKAKPTPSKPSKER